jgi:hypothetical protein
VLECEQLYADAHCHGGALHRMSAFHVFFRMGLCSFLVFRMQYTCDVIVVPCCMNTTISAPFLSQKTVVISFLAARCLFTLFRLVCWIYVHPLLWLLYQELTLLPAKRPSSFGCKPPSHDKAVIFEERLRHSVHTSTNVHHKPQAKQKRTSKNTWVATSTI